jgi:hypothetical protein
MSGLLHSRGGQRLNRSSHHFTNQCMLQMTGHVQTLAELRRAAAQQAQLRLYKPIHAPDDWPCPEFCRAKAGGGSTGPATTVEANTCSRWLAMSGLFQSQARRRLNRPSHHCTSQYMLQKTGHVRTSAELRRAAVQQAQPPLYNPMHAPDDWPSPDFCRAETGGG